MITAEETEAAGTPDELACTVEAQRVYLSATYRFQAPPAIVPDAPAVMLVRRPRPIAEVDDESVVGPPV